MPPKGKGKGQGETASAEDFDLPTPKLPGEKTDQARVKSMSYRGGTPGDQMKVLQAIIRDLVVSGELEKRAPITATGVQVTAAWVAEKITAIRLDEQRRTYPCGVESYQWQWLDPKKAYPPGSADELTRLKHAVSDPIRLLAERAYFQAPESAVRGDPTSVAYHIRKPAPDEIRALLGFRDSLDKAIAVRVVLGNKRTVIRKPVPYSTSEPHLPEPYRFRREKCDDIIALQETLKNLFLEVSVKGEDVTTQWTGQFEHKGRTYDKEMTLLDLRLRFIEADCCLHSHLAELAGLHMVYRTIETAHFLTSSMFRTEKQDASPALVGEFLTEIVDEHKRIVNTLAQASQANGEDAEANRRVSQALKKHLDKTFNRWRRANLPNDPENPWDVDEKQFISLIFPDRFDERLELPTDDEPAQPPEPPAGPPDTPRP